MGQLVVLAAALGVFFLWCWLGSRHTGTTHAAPRRSARRSSGRRLDHRSPVVNGRVVRHGRASGDPVYGLWCSMCGHLGEAQGTRGAEWASREHLRLDHPDDGRCR